MSYINLNLIIKAFMVCYYKVIVDIFNPILFFQIQKVFSNYKL